MLGMFTASFVLVPMDVIWFTRYTFAWSFDRILPSKLADVNSKLRSPVNAIILNIVLGIVWWYLFLYTGIFSVLAASLVGTMISPLLTSIAGIVFPYRNKRIYEASPIKKSIAGIPVVTVFGVFSTIYLLIMIAYYFSFPALIGLAVSQTVGALIVGIFVVCIAYYYIVRAYRLKKEGIDINWAFREVPPV
jgi:amino acid transporter